MWQKITIVWENDGDPHAATPRSEGHRHTHKSGQTREFLGFTGIYV
jgi:hypothetical protein